MNLRQTLTMPTKTHALIAINLPATDLPNTSDMTVWPLTSVPANAREYLDDPAWQAISHTITPVIPPGGKEGLLLSILFVRLDTAPDQPSTI